MDRTQILYAQDWQAGTLDGTRLDTQIAVSPYNQPAIIPAIVPAGTTQYTGVQLVSGTSIATVTGTWVALPDTGGPASPQRGFGSTAGAGWSLAINTTGLSEVTVRFAGQLRMGMPLHVGNTGLVFGAIRNGAIANILVDGTLAQAVDTYQATPAATIYLDGGAHTLSIVHSGQQNAALRVISPVLSTVGHTLGPANVNLTAGGGSYSHMAWRLTALTPSTYQIASAVPVAPGGTLLYTNSGGAQTVGSAVSGLIPNVTLNVTGSLTTGDVCTFSTDVTMIAVESLETGSTSGSIAGTYTTTIFDAGDEATAWHLVKWVKNPPYAGEALPEVTLTVGNLLDGVGGIIGDSSVRPVAQMTRSENGETVAVAGLLGSPQGRYGQLSITLPVTATHVSWLRTLQLYTWIPTPAGDPALLGLAPWPIGTTPNMLTQAMLGTLAVFAEDATQYCTDFVASFGIAEAVDQWLLNHGLDRGLVPVTGEDPTSFRTRLLAVGRSRGRGGSTAFLCEQVATLVNGVDVVPTTSVTSGLNTSTGGGVTVAQTAAFALSVTIPAAPYPGLASLPIALAQTYLTAFVTSLRPMGHSVAMTFL